MTGSAPRCMAKSCAQERTTQAKSGQPRSNRRTTAAATSEWETVAQVEKAAGRNPNRYAGRAFWSSAFDLA